MIIAPCGPRGLYSNEREPIESLSRTAEIRLSVPLSPPSVSSPVPAERERSERIPAGPASLDALESSRSVSSRDSRWSSIDRWTASGSAASY
ncbi:hypothetical protein EL22_26380 [Halostagnicola sp. A56]|nr:hypothetical protein EL22_26380 [Halostagnicola sp. A56]